MGYSLSARADADLVAIFAEGAQMFGPAQADAYLARIERTLDLMATQPLMARLRPEITPPVRIHPVGAHIIVYVVEDGEVYVLRIRHGREDWAPGE